MKTLVMKFGGASVASAEQFSKIADIILARKAAYDRVLVVISAMGSTTDQLIQLAKTVHPDPPRRELDMLISVGERISSALLAMALHAKNSEAISFTGSQSGIITSLRHSDAKIIEVKPARILPHLDAGKIPIVAGFQGVSRTGEITTLGRGGTDTTAVALAIALGADKVEFYKDVQGIYSEDPKKNSDATLFSQMSYTEALDIVLKGAKVLHARAIQLAEKNRLPLHVLSFNSHAAGTLIASPLPRAPTPLFEED